MARNNEERVGSKTRNESPPVSEVASSNSGVLSFATPTEFVELPTRGRFYSQDHPLHNEETIEIRYMTAKDEDILTSRSLLKKGLAIDRLLENIIVDKKIKSQSLFVGDKNAIIIAARVTGYGEKYDTNITCPVCATTQEHSFNLNDKKAVGDNSAKFQEYGISETSDHTFTVTLPRTNVAVEVRLLTGADEKTLSATAEKRRKHKLPESAMTEQFKLFIVSVNGHTDMNSVHSFIEHMPASDSRLLRSAYAAVMPNVDLTQEFACIACGYETEMEVPFTPDFFWPKR